MKGTQREHTTSGDIDHYPEIDCYISEATRIANYKYPDNSITAYNEKWSLSYVEAMNAILHKLGLRVL